MDQGRYDSRAGRMIEGVAPTTTDGATSGSAITGYEYSIDGGNTWPSAGAATSSPFTITGLTNGTIYTVRIRAVNANGSGTSSDPVVSKPYTVPSAPIPDGPRPRVWASDLIPGQLVLHASAS